MSAAVDLFDSHGQPAGLIDDAGRIFGHDGNSIGVVKAAAHGPAAFYNNEGQQIGWFKAGLLHGLDDKVMLAVASRFAFAVDVPPQRPAIRLR